MYYFSKLYLDQISITIKKEGKNIILEQTSKFLNVSKFRTNFFSQIEKINLI